MLGIAALTAQPCSAVYDSALLPKQNQKTAGKVTFQCVFIHTYTSLYVHVCGATAKCSKQAAHSKDHVILVAK